MEEENIRVTEDRTAWRERSCAAGAANVRTDDATRALLRQERTTNLLEGGKGGEGRVGGRGWGGDGGRVGREDGEGTWGGREGGGEREGVGEREGEGEREVGEGGWGVR